MQLSSLLRFCSTDSDHGVRVPAANVADKFPPFDQMDSVWSKFPLASPQTPDRFDGILLGSFNQPTEAVTLSDEPRDLPFKPSGLECFYETKYLRAIAGLPKVRWQEIDGKLLFEFAEDGQGILMPLDLS